MTLRCICNCIRWYVRCMWSTMRWVCIYLKWRCAKRCFFLRKRVVAHLYKWYDPGGERSFASFHGITRSSPQEFEFAFIGPTYILLLYNITYLGCPQHISFLCRDFLASIDWYKQCFISNIYIYILREHTSLNSTFRYLYS